MTQQTWIGGVLVTLLLVQQFLKAHLEPAPGRVLLALSSQATSEGPLAFMTGHLAPCCYLRPICVVRDWCRLPVPSSPALVYPPPVPTWS
jgi:hypothetical protein